MALRWVTRRRHSLRLIIFIITAVLGVPYIILVTHSDSGFDISGSGHRDGERDIAGQQKWRTLDTDMLVVGSAPPGVDRLDYIRGLIDTLEQRKESLLAQYQRLTGGDAVELANSTGNGGATHQRVAGFQQVAVGSHHHLQHLGLENITLQHNSQRLYGSNQDFLNCSSIDHIQLVKRLGKGTSKEVYLGRYRGRDVAVKSVSPIVKDVTACLNRKKYWKKSECFLFANYKIMKEVLLGMQLQHPHILKLLGFCVRSEENSPTLSQQGVVSVTEVGKTIDRKLFARMTWKERLQFSLGIASLLDYLEHSPMGSLIITDFKLDQMLLVDGLLKLGDLDDINNIEGDCQETNCGVLGHNCKKKCAIENTELDIPCVNDKCIGLNAKFNLLKFNRIVFTRVLHDPPTEVSSDIQHIQQRLNSLNITAIELYSSLLAVQST